MGGGRAARTGLSPSAAGLSRPLRSPSPLPWPGPATPPGRPGGLGVVRVRSPLLAESLLSSLPPATEMFHFAGCRAPRPISFGRGRPPRGGRVAPFGHPRIEGRMRLPGAFRSLPRPSSPAAAKASAARPCSLGATKAPGRPCVQQGAIRRLLLDEKTTVRGETPRTTSSRRNESAPRARGAGDVLYLAGGRANPRPLGAVAGLLPCPLPKIAGRPQRPAGEMVVGAHGLGPWTSSLSETRSNQLSYAPGSPGDAPSGDGTAQRGAPGLAPPSGGPAPGKEVIQPQVPLRLPCYDFIPVVDAGLDASRRLRTAPTPMM